MFEKWPVWAVPLIILVSGILAGYVVRLVAYHFLDRWSRKTTTRVDDLIIDATRIPSYFWILIGGLLLTLQSPRIQKLPRHLVRDLDRALVALLIVSITLVLIKVAADLVEYLARRNEDGVFPATSLTRTATQVIVAILGALILLNFLGINITPMLTALGIGGLAVALGLQDTLSNLFAGFYVTLARQIRIGQRIHLDSGQEGYVVDIGWRTTSLRTPSNYLIIVPNGKLAQSIITNYNFPTEPVNIVFTLGVGYDSDPAHVERVLMEEGGKAVKELQGFVAEFEPIVRFQEMADFSLKFLFILQVESYDAQFGVWGELNKRIFNRFKQEGIDIPFPIRTLYLKEGHLDIAHKGTADH